MIEGKNAFVFGKTASDEHHLDLQLDLLLNLQRQEGCHTPPPKLASFIADGLKFQCMVREVSRTGVTLELSQPVPRAAPFALEMPNGDIHPIDLVWSKRDLAGFRFLEDMTQLQFVQLGGNGDPAIQPDRGPVRIANLLGAALVSWALFWALFTVITAMIR